MKLSLSVLTTAFVAVSVVKAHFEISFPETRGPFVEDNEPQFCDGYTQPANRTPFPLTNGFIVWNTSHDQWTAGVMLSTAAAPESFNDFHNSSGGDQLVVGYYQGTGTSGLCVRVNANEAGIPGIQDGSNVTLQMVFNGGDGILYQCMDLTLDANYTIPSNITCTNPQGAPPSSNGTGTTPPATPSSKGGAISVDVNGLLGLGLAGVLAAILV